MRVSSVDVLCGYFICGYSAAVSLGGTTYTYMLALLVPLLSVPSDMITSAFHASGDMNSQQLD